MTSNECIKHWFNYGKLEGRQPFGSKCGIAVSTYHINLDRIESFKQCITSIMTYKKTDTIVFVVDDGSSIHSHIEWVHNTFPSIQVVKKKENRVKFFLI